MKYYHSLFFILLVIIGIPWYWNEKGLLIYFGFPIWVIIAIITSFLASCLTAFIILKPQDKKDYE
tara:strand:+ start:135 stop:329 length:195 start_codon:yes stop_codon:yes gene_type:complete